MIRRLRDPAGTRALWEMSYKQRRKILGLRQREEERVNDDAWRSDLQPITSHPRREKRGQGKPR